jgi:hypothetical protein
LGLETGGAGENDGDVSTRLCGNETLLYDEVCICGRSESYKGCLSWVLFVENAGGQCMVGVLDFNQKKRF